MVDQNSCSGCTCITPSTLVSIDDAVVCKQFRNYFGDELLNSASMNTPPGLAGADLRNNSISRIDFPTHRIHALILWTMLWFVSNLSEVCWRWNIKFRSNDGSSRWARRRVAKEFDESRRFSDAPHSFTCSGLRRRSCGLTRFLTHPIHARTA